MLTASSLDNVSKTISVSDRPSMKVMGQTLILEETMTLDLSDRPSMKVMGQTLTWEDIHDLQEL
jgi:hypothetical protein